jgi:predicted nucleic acid-binding protein
VSPDPADNFLFALAQAGEAAYLVSDDKSGVLAMRQHGACQMVRIDSHKKVTVGRYGCLTLTVTEQV